jgi:hypothetical protein
MKYVGLIAALAMACILVMPAFSMPDQGDGKMDSKFNKGQAMCGQDQICPQCHQPMGPMGDDGKQKCRRKGTDCGQKHVPKSMMDGKQIDGKAFCQKPIKSMMDGKCQGPTGAGDDGKKQMTECQGPMGAGDDCRKQMIQCQGPTGTGDDGKKQMTECQGPMGPMGPMGDDGKKQMTQCQNKEGGEKFGPKSMMDGKEIDGNASCPRSVKSMMGDGKGEKGETAIFVLVCR